MDAVLRSLLTHLVDLTPDVPVVEIVIGLHWTCVTVEYDGTLQAGLASTLPAEAGRSLEERVLAVGQDQPPTSREVAAWVFRDPSPFTSAGIATLNALFRPNAARLSETNAEVLLQKAGAGKKVAMVGRFPFADRLKAQVGELFVLEAQPAEGEYHQAQAPEILPAAQVVAITGMALVNHTLGDLLAACDPDASIMLLGPSTPLHPLLFEYGVDVLSGSLVEAIPAVVQAVREGAGFRTIHRQGVRLVNLLRPGLNGWD